ncbi:PilZ domain-containing protein [Sphingomonas xinjiangensis]|uniref:PilZ domain-containing protein n=1 Tax=Sphingomonas xinjiangensis TaxID=643568 RepID=A0A840Y6U7_9SPHN|nr:PilZ domain-containing protein [Sphingomonas xinjiangensis]MBB5709007.1 hypothetical protein [Sphingomonas xinjiangensis]
MEQFTPESVNALSAEDFTVPRSGARDSLLLTAQFRVKDTDEVHQVRVRNLSSGGLMAEFAGPIMPGTLVEIEVRGVGWVSGRIAWATDGRVGVAFSTEIDPLLARKPVGKGTMTPSYTKPLSSRR